MRLLSAPWIDPARVQGAFDLQRRRDPFGLRLHEWVATLWFFLVPWFISAVEFAMVPLAVALLLRLPHLWRLRASWLTQPLVLLLVAWAAWLSLSLTWTLDSRAGYNEVGGLRWAWTVLAVWPVVERRPRFIVALIAGFLVANLAQLAHAVGLGLGLDWLTFDRNPDRNSGWWRPVVGGSMLVGALGLHLPAALMGVGRTRVLGLAGSVVTLLGIVATGTRGAWLAGAGLIGIVAVVALIRARARISGRSGVTFVGAMLVVVVGAWLAVGPSIARRAGAGWHEVARAVEQKEFTSDTGARLIMGWWAMRAFAEHPVAGVGAGGYRRWVIGHLERRGIDPADRSVHDHAHNAALHVGATTGVVGLALAGLLGATALVGAFRGPSGGGGERLGTYAAGPGFALIGLLLVSAFDTIHVNAQTGALLCALLALCLAPRPRPLGEREADG